MSPRNSCVSQIYLKPAMIFFDASPACVSTVLGSCVTLTMLVRRLELASVCHAQLPYCKTPGSCATTCSEKYKFVDCAITRMLESFTGCGAALSEIEIKIFGGADGIRGDTPGGQSIRIGKMNIEAAIRTLRQRELKPVSGDVGGSRGRKIYFLTPTGDVWSKKLSAGEPCPRYPENVGHQNITLGGFTICPATQQQDFNFL
ncbi:MAG: chemotaxis protein CheD [Proteobacteria bacterium]|nr:chemotaxis protein CheD [Pseudomonadota bacterium]MBU1737249.1 chemotaxis protein CheD [Pseudomonadota bacterium]